VKPEYGCLAAITMLPDGGVLVEVPGAVIELTLPAGTTTADLNLRVTPTVLERFREAVTDLGGARLSSIPWR